MLRARDVDNGRSMKTKTCAEAPVTFHRGLREYGYHHEIRAECAGCGATFWAGAEEDALRMVQDHLNPPAVKCKVRWIDDATGKPTDDTNDAIGWAVCQGHRYPVCREHAKQIDAFGAFGWTFEPFGA